MCWRSHHLLLAHEHGLYRFSLLSTVANPGILAPLPGISVENGFQVVPVINYETADGVITVSWCRTCHFYKQFHSPAFIVECPPLITAACATAA